jgi:4-hydroxy-tetrahydrodipicolinate synthase
MNSTSFCGAHTALVTPFRDGVVDYPSLGRLVDFQISEGIQGLVAVGTTGESPTLDYEEHIEVIRFTVERAAGRVPVLAGTGSNSTTEQAYLTKRAEDAGATGFLLVAPYYNRPSQEGLYRHFADAARRTEKPIVLYSIPNRCGVEIAVPTVKRLRREFPHIVGLKDSGGSCDRIALLHAELGPEFILLCGDDALTLPFIANGAHGVISVASNLAVRAVAELVSAARAGDLARAQAVQAQNYPLFKDLFAEPSPAPIKYALFRAGLIAAPEVRLPLVEFTAEGRVALDKTLEDLKLI